VLIGLIVPLEPSTAVPYRHRRRPLRDRRATWVNDYFLTCDSTLGRRAPSPLNALLLRLEERPAGQ
jgi:hypothetical protein